MKVIILAGGYGTRLQPITFRTPKSILPLGDTNILLELLDQLENVQVEEIILSLNQTQEKVQNFVDNLKYKQKITCFFEESESNLDKLGAVGALLYVVKKFGADDMLVLGADNYFKGLNLNEMVQQHVKTHAEITIAHYDLKDLSKVSNFGVSVVNKDNRILEFQEKPSTENARSTLVSTFVYLINKRFLDTELPKYVKAEVDAGRTPDNMGGLWAYFSKDLSIYAYTFIGYWGDVGNAEGYIDTNRQNLEGLKNEIDSQVKISNSAKITGKVKISRGCEIAADVVLIGPCFLGENVKINQGSIIGPNSIILHDSIIGSNNSITGAILFEKVETSNCVKICRAVIDGNSKIQKNSNIKEYTLIGYGSEIGESTKILSNSKIWPFICIEKESIIDSTVYYQNVLTEWKPILRASKYWESI